MHWCDCLFCCFVVHRVSFGVWFARAKAATDVPSDVPVIDMIFAFKVRLARTAWARIVIRDGVKAVASEICRLT